MRRNEADVSSQPIRNLFKNPAMESTEGSQSTPFRSNYLSNPAFRAVAPKSTVFRQNMLTNPSMETAGDPVTVRENLLPNPGVERPNGTLVVRANYSANPRGTGEFQKYANTSVSQETVAVTNHPEGIETAARITYTGSGSNPGVAILSVAEAGTTYTMSAWVYHESVMSVPGQAGFAQAGVTSKGHDFELNKWVRYSWTHTANSTNLLGYRIGGQSGTGTGSFLITGILVERAGELRPFFDHATPADAGYTYVRTTQGYTQQIAPLPASFGANTNASRVWQSQDIAYTGTKSLCCESVSATGTGNGINTRISGLPVGTYTFSAYVYMSSLYGQGLHAAARGSGDDTLYRSPTKVVLDNWQRVSITFEVTTVGETWLYILAASTAPVGSFFHADAFMLEKSDTLNPYFDADTPRQNLVSNPNFAAGIKGWSYAGTGNAAIFHDTSVTYHGGASLRVETNGSDVNQGAYTTTRQEVKTSREYTASVWVRGTKGNRLLLEYAELDATVTDVASRSRVWYTLTSNDWEKISLTRAMSDKAVTSQVLVRVPAAVANTYWVGAVLVEAGDQQSEFYEDTGDFSYTWSSGGANSSSSLQNAFSVPDITSANVLTYRSRAKAHSGTYSLYVTGSGTAQNTHAAPVVLNTVIGAQYTVSAWVYLMEDSVNLELQVSGIPSDITTGVAAARGKWIRVYQTITATGPTHMLRLRTRSDGRAHFFIDDFLFEAGVSIQPYFDGSTGTDNGLEHAWADAPHASTSTQSGTLAIGQHVLYRENESPHGRFWGYQAFDNGTPVARWVSPAGTPSTSWRVACWGYTAMEHSKIVEGKSYTILFKYRSWGWRTADESRNGAQISTASSGNHVLSSTTTPKIQMNNTEWVEYRHSFTALRSSENTQMIYLPLPAVSHADSNGVFETKETALIDGKYDGPYFDGSTDLKDSDISAGWTSAVDGSASVLNGTGITGPTLTLTHGAAISSTMWKWSGTKSMRLIAQDSGSVDSFVDIKGMVDLSLLKPHTTYTISGIRYQKNVLTGTINLRGFRVNLGGSELVVAGPLVRNVVGPQAIWGTFTTGEKITGNYSYIRLYNGSTGGKGDVWWDDICLSEGDNGTRYVDGTMREARWEGTAHASESVGYAETIESLVGSPILMYDTPGTRKLDPTVLDESSPRTFYSIIYSEKVVGSGVVDASLTYGIEPLVDNVPNQTLTIRMQPGSGEWNNLLVRRTNGQGPLMSGVPAPGYSISYGGLNEQGNLFAGRYGVTKLVTDSVQMTIPHQAIRIEGDDATHRHVATYLFRGMHDDYTRDKVSKLLAIKHGLPELL